MKNARTNKFGRSAVSGHSLLSLMQMASVPNASYSDTNTCRNGICVERMKDDNTISFGNFRVTSLLDSQWVAIYKALKEWLEWCDNQKGVRPQDVKEYRVQISPDKDAYQLWNVEDPETFVLNSWESIFNKDGVNLN